MRVLVLGARGFVGRHVVDALVGSGHEVVAGVRPGTSAMADGPGVQQVSVDPVADPDSLRAVLEQGVGGVINAAGQISGTLPEIVAANALLVAQLVEGLKSLPQSRRPRLVHVGSAAEYSPPVGRAPVAPEHPTIPLGPYGVTKLCGTNLVVGALRADEIVGTVVRLFNPVGPGSPASTLAGSAVERLREAVEQDHAEIRFGDLHPARDFIDVRDAAELLVKACLHRGDLPEIMNGGTGAAIPAWDLVEALSHAAAWRGSVITDGSGSPRSAVPWQAADIATTLAYLDWRPRRSLEETARDQWLARSAHVGAAR